MRAAVLLALLSLTAALPPMASGEAGTRVVFYTYVANVHGIASNGLDAYFSPESSWRDVTLRVRGVAPCDGVNVAFVVAGFAPVPYPYEYSYAGVTGCSGATLVGPATAFATSFQGKNTPLVTTWEGTGRGRIAFEFEGSPLRPT